jgi:integrase
MTAKILTSKEIEIVLDHISQKKHSTRNRLLIIMNHYSGMKVSEISNITIGDVVDANNQLQNYITLPTHKILINSKMNSVAKVLNG